MEALNINYILHNLLKQGMAIKITPEMKQKLQLILQLTLAKSLIF